MHYVIWGIVALAGAALLLFTRKASATETETPKVETLEALFKKHAAIHGIDWKLLAAIAFVESSLNPSAVRWNPPRDVSVGLMQILCVPPKDYSGEGDYTAANDFNIEPWPVTFEQLKDADLNISLGAQILAWNLRTFGFPRGVAVYNRWESRKENEQGPFTNQSYVDKVLKRLSTLSV